MTSASSESRQRAASLSTVSDVIDALGGVGEVARLTGRSYRNAWNWKKAQKFSAPTYVRMRDALADLGLSAPPHLWGIDPPDDEGVRP